MAIPRDFPIFRSLRGRSYRDLGGDLLAGLTLAAIAIPEQMATARLGGFAPQIGFFAFIAGSLAFAIFGASRCTSAGADSTIAPIFAGGLALLAATGSPAYGSLAAGLALLVGAILVLGGLFRTGWIADLLSVPVTTGFLAGIAIHIVVSQLPALLGIPGGNGEFFPRVAALIANGRDVNCYALALGLVVFLITFISEKTSARIPGALLGLIVVTLAVSLLHLEKVGVAVLGIIPSGLPRPALPALGLFDYVHLVALALVIAIVVMVQTAATARSFTSDQDAPPDVNRDFIGVGAASLLAGLFRAFPVNASPPRTAAAAESGGRSQVSGILAAALVAVLIAFGPGLLVHIPTAALAGILLFVALRITRVPVFAQVYRQSKGEFGLTIATVIAIVVLPIQIGVAVGVVLSLLHGVWLTTRTRVLEFARLPGTSIWWPPLDPGKGEKVDGVMVLAFQAPLSFLNAYDFRAGILGAIHGARQPLKAVVLEASSIVEFDYTAARILADVIAQCRAANIFFAIARLESVRGQLALARFGITDLLGPGCVFQSVQEAIDHLPA